MAPCKFWMAPASSDGALHASTVPWMVNFTLRWWPVCLDDALHAWMVPCMLGLCPVCLDGALHALMAPGLYAWMVPCVLGWCYVLYVFASADSLQNARKTQCTNCHNRGSNPAFAGCRAGALSTGPRCHKKVLAAGATYDKRTCKKIVQRAPWAK